MDNEIILAEERIVKACEEYLITTGGKLSTEQKKLFFGIAKACNLNPFKHEIYAMPMKNKETGNYDLTIVVGFEVYLKRAEASGKLKGWRAEIVGEGLNMRAIVTIEKEGWAQPFIHEVDFSEYQRDTAIWRKKPKTMLKKVGIGQAFKLAFPDENGGLPDAMISDNIDDLQDGGSAKEIPMTEEQAKAIFKKPEAPSQEQTKEEQKAPTPPPLEQSNPPWSGQKKPKAQDDELLTMPYMTNLIMTMEEFGITRDLEHAIIKKLFGIQSNKELTWRHYKNFKAQVEAAINRYPTRENPITDDEKIKAYDFFINILNAPEAGETNAR